METLKQFGDKHVSMETHGQQYNTTIYNINFELGHTTASTANTVQCVNISLSRLIDVCLHQLNTEDCNRNLSETAMHSVPWIAVFKVICDQFLLWSNLSE
jgi:hypothetical protein